MTDTKNIPQSLRDSAKFCVWKLEQRDGKPTKVPYDSLTGMRAKSNDISTFGSFEEVEQAQERYSGIGVGIFGSVCAIDIDHCIEDGVIKDFAQDIINRMCSYTEISPSGTGIHIFFSAEGFQYHKAKYYINNQKAGLEVYIAGVTQKYVTLTGNIVEPYHEFRECGDTLQGILDEYMKRDPSAPQSSDQTQAQSAKPSSGALSDDKLITKACELQKFADLWHGDTSGYKSQSEADLALCNYLAFYARKDPFQMDRLFRQSSLMREKWDELHGADTYGYTTVNRAITGCKDVYDPIAYLGKQKASAADDFGDGISEDVSHNLPYIYYDEHKKKNVVSAPFLYNFIRENMKYLFVKSEVKSAVQRYVYRDGCYRHVSDDEFKGFIKRYIPLVLQSTRTVNEVFGLLITDNDRFYTPDDLNTNENYINFQNCILNFDDMTMIEHSPDILSTIQIPCNYNPNVTPPKSGHFDRFINHLCYNDKERIQLVLEFMGVALSNVAGYRAKKALIMVGQGNTGKSQCKELITKLIGKEYTSGLDISELESRFGASNIYGKRMAGSSDMGYMTVNEMKKFKKITGGDTISIEYKGENGFSFKYNGILWFCCNEVPKFGGDKGDWVYDRMMVLECNNPVEKKDPGLLEKMYTEREYIVYRCVQALREFVKREYRYTTPQCTVDAVKQYQIDNDSVRAFIVECTVPRPNGKISDNCTTTKTYKVYAAYCKESGLYPEKKTNFMRTLESINMGDTIKTNGFPYYKMFTLSPEAKKEFEYLYGF